MTQAPELLAGISSTNIIADKGYDSAAVVAQIATNGSTAVIPSRRNARMPRTYDRHLYRERHCVENFFQRIKRNRRIAMRFEKLAIHFLAMVQFAAIMVLLA